MALRHVALSALVLLTLVAACHIETSSSNAGGDDDDDDSTSGKSKTSKDSKEATHDETDAEKDTERGPKRRFRRN